MTLSSLIEDWLAAGIISPDQASRMTSYGDVPVAAARPEHSRTQLVALEALGYVGGVVVLVSTILIMNLYWPDLSDGTRTTGLALTTVALTVAGFLTPPRLGGVGVRMRSVLWLAATASLAGFLVLLTRDVLGLSSNDAVLLASIGTAAGAATLSRGSCSPGRKCCNPSAPSWP